MIKTNKELNNNNDIYFHEVNHNYPFIDKDFSINTIALNPKNG